HNFVTGVEAIPGSLPRPLAPTTSPSIDARSLAQQPQQSQVNDDQPPNRATDPVPPKASSGPGTSSTEAPASTLSDSGPTLGDVTEDGNKATPNTSTKTTSPKKKPLTQLADTFKGFRSGKKTPASSTPSSEPQDSAPSTSPSQGQSHGPASNAAYAYALSAESPMTCRARNSASSSSVRPRSRRTSSLCWPRVGGADRWCRVGPGAIVNGQPG